MYLIPVVVLGLVTAILLWRNRPLGYLGTWIFAILAPTSLIPILTETVAERRMYLPLVSVVVVLVIGSYLLMHSIQQRWIFRFQVPAKLRQTVFIALPILL